MNVSLRGPIRPSSALNQATNRALKSHRSGRDFFTDVTLIDSRHGGGMRIEFGVTATSPASAERAGLVYLSQLCDLLSVITQSPIWFYMPDDDARDERLRMNRQTSTIDRILTEDEWSWIAGSLVFLRREHPRFLAAASWYRKGLVGKDCLDGLCCFWRTIERLAEKYCDKSGWPDADRSSHTPIKKAISQIVDDLFPNESVPAIFTDRDAYSKVHRLRNDISHGNKPITVDLIDSAATYLKSLEDAAFQMLRAVREQKLTDASAA